MYKSISVKNTYKILVLDCHEIVLRMKIIFLVLDGCFQRWWISLSLLNTKRYLDRMSKDLIESLYQCSDVKYLHRLLVYKSPLCAISMLPSPTVGWNTTSSPDACVCCQKPLFIMPSHCRCYMLHFIYGSTHCAEDLVQLKQDYFWKG